MTAHAAFGLSIEQLDVVVVEESRNMQALMCSMLASDRVHRIRVFDGPEQAMEAMLAEPPHLIVSDLEMKPVTGYQLLRALRRPNMAPLAFVPFIMSTALATRSIVELTSRAGVHAFLVKPLAPQVLRRAIKRVLADGREISLGEQGYVLEKPGERVPGTGSGEDARRPGNVAERPERAFVPPSVSPAARDAGRYGAVLPYAI